MCCKRLIGNTGRKNDAKKSPSEHHRTTLSGYFFATKACIDNRKKKPVKLQYLLQMSLQYGELRPTSGWDRLVGLWHPIIFQWVSRLDSVTARQSTMFGRATITLAHILVNKFFFQLSIPALVTKIWPDKIVQWCPDFLASFWVLHFQRATCSTFQTCILNSH